MQSCLLWASNSAKTNNKKGVICYEWATPFLTRSQLIVIELFFLLPSMDAIGQLKHLVLQNEYSENCVDLKSLNHCKYIYCYWSLKVDVFIGKLQQLFHFLMNIFQAVQLILFLSNAVSILVMHAHCCFAFKAAN